MSSRLVYLLIIFLCLISCKENYKTAVPRLITELASSKTSEKNRAALALAAYGEDAAEAVPALIKTLGDKNGGVRSSAAYALRSINTKEAEKALEVHVEDKG